MGIIEDYYGGTSDFGQNLGGMPALDASGSTYTGAGMGTSNYNLTNFDSGKAFGNDFGSLGLDADAMEMLSGTNYVADYFGMFNPGTEGGKSDIINWAMNENPISEELSVWGKGKAMLGKLGETELGADVKSAAGSVWDTINNPGNKTGVTLGALFINGMLGQSTRKQQAQAMSKSADAAMLNAEVNKGQLAINQKKLENASAIKNTTFGQPTGLIYADKLAERRARNGA